MTSAHGYAQLTGRAQAVVVHVDCRTQALGGAVQKRGQGARSGLHFRRISPSTQEGEAGSRNESRASPISAASSADR